MDMPRLAEVSRIPGKTRKNVKKHPDKTGWQENCRPFCARKERTERGREIVKTWKTALLFLFMGRQFCPVWSQKSGKTAEKSRSGTSTRTKAGEQERKTSPRMRFMGKFDAGVPNAGICKLYDETDDVVCCIRMPYLPVPEASRKASCMKATRSVPSVASGSRFTSFPSMTDRKKASVRRGQEAGG